MNYQAQFLKQIKDQHPRVFAAAVRKVQMKRAFAGLGDDLTSDLTVDPSTISIDPTVSAAVDQAASSGDTSDAWSGFFSAISDAVSNVAPTLVQSQAQLAAIKANQQRVAAGYAPNVTASSLMTGVGSALTSGSGIMIMGVGLLAVILLAKKR